MIIRQLSEKQIKDLKKAINKTEYEKAREPLIKEITQANNDIFELERKLKIMQDAFILLVTGIKDDYIDVVVDTAIPEARFFTNQDDFERIDYTTIKKVRVPLKDNLMRDLIRIYNQLGDDED